MSSSISSHQNLYDMAEARRHQGSPAANEIFYDDDMLGMSMIASLPASPA
jgi:hypothetical protein